jgi:hypothetical protein
VKKTTSLPTRLIFIDGIPTTGKSTTAHLLTLQMQKAGIEATWYYEEEPGNLHPVHVYGEMDSEVFVERSLARYREFAKRAESSQGVTVLEGSFLMNSVLVLFGRDDIEGAAIKDYVRRVLSLTRRLSPTLIYLYRSNIADALNDMAGRRSPQWREWFIDWWTGGKPYVKKRGWTGFEGAVEFWSVYQSFTDEIFSECDMPKLAVETSGSDWADHLCTILRFLGIPRLEEEALPENALEKFVGTYEDPEGRIRARNGPKEISIWLERGQLFIGGLKWPRMRLIACSEACFLVEGITIELAFQEGLDGQILGFTVCGRQVDSMLGATLIKLR